MPHLLLKDLPKYECLLDAAKEIPEMDPSACEVFLNLLRTGDEVFAVVEANYANYHISQGRFGVLMLLWSSRLRPENAAPGACAGFNPRTPAELAEKAGVTRATMTGLIDTLERDGLVKREADPADRRAQLVTLTPKAQALMRQMLPGHFHLMSLIMGPLTEAERKTLVRILNKIAQQASGLAATARVSAPGGGAVTG